MDKVCGNCVHYFGGGDWNLCCDVHHPIPMGKSFGLTFYAGYLCYEDTLACDMFEENKSTEEGK